MTDFLARARLPASEGSMEAEIVLRKMASHHPPQYVTHQHNILEGDTRGFYWGNYFSDEVKAWEDFVSRVQDKIINRLAGC